MADTKSRPQPKGLYKITIHAYRRKDMSEESFHHHWTNIHAPKISAFLQKHGIVGYTQYHTPSWVRAEAAKELKTLGPFATDNIADFDGYVELRMPRLSCYERARKDPYYEEVVKPDEEAFFDFERSRMTVGWEETYVDMRNEGDVEESVMRKAARS